MESKRCFSPDVVRSGAFLDMPASAQALYFQIGISTDERGVCSNAKVIAKLCNASVDDLKILVLKKFLVPLDDNEHEMNLVLDKLFNINNTIEHLKRFKESQYFNKIKHFKVTKNLVYSATEDGVELVEGKALSKQEVKEFKPSVGHLSDTCRTEVEREVEVEIEDITPSIVSPLGKEIEKPTKRFVKPTVEEIKEYCTQRNNNVDANQFYDFYESKGWMVGKNKMKDWKAAVRLWESNRNNSNNSKPNKPRVTDYDWLDNGE